MAKDLREFLNQLENHGLLVHIQKQVNAMTEMGGLFSDHGIKPLMFENVKGYPGWKVTGEFYRDPKAQALAIGAPEGKVLAKLAERLESPPTKCKIVPTGPVKQKITLGSDIDLSKFPFIVHSDTDPGPYIGSGICITRDPDTGIDNLAIHRMQIKTKNHTGVMFAPNEHTARNYAKYEERNIPMPMAVFIGHHPLVEVASVTTGAYEMNELELAGTLMGEPLEMVKAETIDLEVPAYAEIVIEGEVPPKIREKEGPFGEFTNHARAGEGNHPIFNVKAITMRKDAIYRHIQSIAFTDHQALAGLPMRGVIYKRVVEVDHGLDIWDVNVPHWGVLFLVIIKMTPHKEGEAKKALMAALSGPYSDPKIAIAVDEDVDSTSAEEIFWSISARVNPETDVFIIPGVTGDHLDQSLPLVGEPDQKVWTWRMGGKMGIDATKPPTSRPNQRAKFRRTLPIATKKWTFQELFKI